MLRDARRIVRGDALHAIGWLEKGHVFRTGRRSLASGDSNLAESYLAGAAADHGPDRSHRSPCSPTRAYLIGREQTRDQRSDTR